MSDDNSGWSDLDRRRWLQLVGGGAAAGLAGCTGGDGGGDTPTPTPSPEETDILTPTPTPEGSPTPTPEPETRPHGGTLTVANESNLTGLDPHKTASVVSWNVLYNVCETLTTFRQGKIAGRLAEDWSVGPRGRKYTFTLKQGVQFHPPVSREMVADDVVYSFERMQREKAQMSGDLSVVDSVEATGDYEVTFTLKQTFAPFIQFLARVPWVVVPKEAVQRQTGSTYGVGEFQKPVGTGPFAFEEHVQGDHTTLSAFDGFRQDGVPFVDEVRFTPVPDADSRVLALRKGNVDFARQTPGKDAQSLEKREDVDVITSKASAWGEIYINNSQPPWDDPAVRRAVAQVVNRPAVVQAGLYGYGSAAWQPFYKSSYWHVDPLETARKRNVERAKQILADAGNPLEGKTLEIKTTTAYQIMESTALIAVQNLNQAGIDAEINKLEWGTMLGDFLKGNFGAMAFSIPHKVDPDRYYYSFIHPDGPQYLKYGEDQPDAKRMYELIQQGRTTTDLEERKAIYDELQTLVSKNVPWVSIAHRHNVLGMRSNVEGDPTWLLPYNRLWRLSKGQ